MTADQLKAELVVEANRRARALAVADDARDKLAALAAQIPDTDGVSMAEAARLTGLTRAALYLLVSTRGPKSA